MSKTIFEILVLSEKVLKESGIGRPRREAEELIADVLGKRRLDLYLAYDRPLDEGELEGVRKALRRRKEGEPTPYIAGKVEFGGVEITISKAVLIPRPETEILVEEIAKTLDNRLLEGKVLWDMCTGSGCIGIALKKRFPELRVVLSDCSEEALEVAQANAKLNGIEVAFRYGDLFEPFKGEKCDFFVSNPPYVSEEEYEGLSPEVRDFEPKIALVGGATGVEFYERIAASLDGYLSPRGCGWMEIGDKQGEPVSALFKKAGWDRCGYEPDWAGHDRFFFLEKPS